MSRKRLYRVTPARFADDLTGEGSRLHGGRWSPPGIAVIHTTESSALAAMEFLVHLVSMISTPKRLRLVCYELDDDAPIEEFSMARLPGSWREVPPPPSLLSIGEDWACREEAIALRVPSVVMPFGEERNLLINPRFPEFRKLFRIVSIDPFSYDNRLPLPEIEHDP